MTIQGEYINVNGGQVITEPIEVRYKVEADKVLIKYYLGNDFEPMRLCVESQTTGMTYDELGNELGVMPIRTRKYLPSVIFGVFEDVEVEILNRLKDYEI